MSRYLALALIVTSVSSTAEAQRRQQRNDPPEGEAEAIAEAPTLDDLDTIAARLQSPNPDEVREAIDLLSIIDHPAVIPHLEALLRAGQPDAITDRALEALGALGHAGAVDILAAFTHHRRAGARRRAYQSLAAIQDRRVRELLETGLSDSDRSIRGQVALSLGETNARPSLDLLFRAFERGVIEAAIAIGKLGDRTHVNRYNEHLGQKPLAIMLSGYGEFLRRRDVPVEVKTEIVGSLGEVSGPMVRRFLQEYLGTFAERDRSPLRRHVEETIRRIPQTATGVRLGPGGEAPPSTTPTGATPPTGGAQ
jgi:HEAT repeat protein